MAAAQTYQSEFTGSQMDERFRAVATLAEALTVLEQAIAAKYTKPADGIPSTDMDASVQSALALALTSVQSLADYYTKSEVDQLLAAINGMDYVDVSTLPTASASTMGKIYLVGPDASGYYSYYYTSYNGSAYSWVGPLGTTEISLANYATKTELGQLDQKVDGDVQIFNRGSLTGNGVGTNVIRYFQLEGGRYVLTMGNFAKTKLTNELKLQIGYYPNRDRSQTLVVLRQMNNSTTEDVDVSGDYDISIPDNAELRLVIRGDVGAVASYEIKNKTFDNTKRLSFVGADNLLKKSSGEFIPLTAGRIYRFTPKNANWPHSAVTYGDANAVMIGYRSNGSEVVLSSVNTGTWQLKDYYDVQIPNNAEKAFAFVGGYADEGTIVEFYVEDVTEEFAFNNEIMLNEATFNNTITASHSPKYAVFPCNITAGKKYRFMRWFDTPYPLLYAGSSANSGLKIWTSNQSGEQDSTNPIDTIELIYYKSSATFKRYIDFTATADASFLHIYIQAEYSGFNCYYSIGRLIADEVLELKADVGGIDELVESRVWDDVQIFRRGTIKTLGATENAVQYLHLNGGDTYKLTMANFEKSPLNAYLKFQIGYYPNENVLANFVVIRQIDSTSSVDTDVSGDYYVSIPEGALFRIVLRGTAGQNVPYSIENISYQRLPDGTERRYDGDGIKVFANKNKYFDQIIPVPGIATYDGKSLQGLAIYGKYGFITYNTGYIQVLDMDTLTIVSSYAMPEGVQNPNNHAGMANFSKIFYDASDDFPLLYVSSYIENKCYVLRVDTSGCSLIQTITMADAWHFMPDNDGNLIVHMNDWSTYQIFTLPQISAAEVTLLAADAKDSFSFELSGMQTAGTFCQDGKMFILCYYTTGSWKYDRMVVYDYKEKKQKSVIIFENTAIRSREFEGISPGENGEIYISFVYDQLAKIVF